MRSSLSIFSYCLPKTINLVGLHICRLSGFSPLTAWFGLSTRHSPAFDLDYSSADGDNFISVANFKMVILYISLAPYALLGAL